MKLKEFWSGEGAPPPNAKMLFYTILGPLQRRAGVTWNKITEYLEERKRANPCRVMVSFTFFVVYMGNTELE